MKAKNFVEQEILKFQELSLEEKMTKLYEEHLLLRFSQQLEYEELPSIDFTEEDIIQHQKDDLEYRISNLIFTAREVLFIAKASGIWDVLLRQFGSNRSAAIVLNILTRQNAQSLQNLLSGTPTKGVNDQDYVLKGDDEQEFFAKLDSLPKAQFPNTIKEALIKWNNRNQRI